MIHKIREWFRIRHLVKHWLDPEGPVPVITVADGNWSDPKNWEKASW